MAVSRLARQFASRSDSTSPSTHLDVPADASRIVETDIPARLDRLRWGPFHTLVVMALGITWILDGLEVTLAGSLSGALKQSPVLHLTNIDVGFANSAYLVGAVIGALGFGWLTDRLGRSKLFFTTLAVYLLATAATAFSWNAASYTLFRCLTGAGIGGEYTAINSTIQEFVPARYRGWTDLVINGSFWVGAALGAASTTVLLDPAIINPEIGWRLAFFIGAGLGLIVFVMRSFVPESPRWLVIHGDADRAAAIVDDIEQRVQQPSTAADRQRLPRIRLHQRRATALAVVLRTLVYSYRSRAVLGLGLMAAQAFFYNAIFFTYALVLTDFFGIASDRIGLYILPFAAGNFLGPVLLGRLFDSLGRRVMITFTYAVSGVLLAVSGYLFSIGLLSAQTQTVAWMIVFFFASPAASSAYLTVSETFPLEIRALAIALFYAIGTGIGGVAGPALFGVLIESGSRNSVFAGYLFGSILMVGAAVLAWRLCVPSERKPLEQVARPLAAIE